MNGKERQMSPHERLITEGEALQEIYFVLSGLFSVGSEASESFSTVGPGGSWVTSRSLPKMRLQHQSLHLSKAALSWQFHARSLPGILPPM
jgi:CRP-like cAMP-binding protein